MLRGSVIGAHQAVVAVGVIGARGRRAVINAVIDTGFNGRLTLPQELAERLELRLVGEGDFTLADGSRAELRRYRAVLEWVHGPVVAIIVATHGPPLLGMRLLRDCDLTMPVVEGGEVTIAPVA